MISMKEVYFTIKTKFFTLKRYLIISSIIILLYIHDLLFIKKRNLEIVIYIINRIKL